MAKGKKKSLEPPLKRAKVTKDQGGRRSSNWEDLLPELLELVLQKLSAMDYLKCRRVCSRWRDAIDHYALASEVWCPPKPELPYILTLSLNESPKLVSLTQRRVFHMPFPSRSASFFLPRFQITSIHGWLMFQGSSHRRHLDSDGTHNYCCSTLSFLNPVSGAKFKLAPFLFPGTWDRYDLIRFGFGFTPSSSKFLVAMLITGDLHRLVHYQELAFCRVKQDSWTWIRTKHTESFRLEDIAVHDNKLFAIAKKKGLDTVLIFSLDDPNAIIAIHAVRCDPIPTVPMIRDISYYEEYLETNRLVRRLAVDSSSGEFLMVLQVMDKAWKRRKISYRTKGFHVLRLELEGNPKWFEVKDLGDRFLFVDGSRASVVSARGLDGSAEFDGGNCIFFCHANTFHDDKQDAFSNHDVGIFSLASKTIQPFSFAHSLPSAFRDIWFSPSIW